MKTCVVLLATILLAACQTVIEQESNDTSSVKLVSEQVESIKGFACRHKQIMRKVVSTNMLAKKQSVPYTRFRSDIYGLIGGGLCMKLAPTKSVSISDRVWWFAGLDRDGHSTLAVYKAYLPQYKEPWYIILDNGYSAGSF